MLAKRPRSGMMGQLVPSMAPPPAAQKSQRRRDRLLRLLGGLTLLAPLGGCTLGRELPNIVYVAIGANKDQLINAELKQALQDQLMKVGARYRQIHPDTHFQYGIYPEDQMVEVMRRRSWSGLAPDLVLVNGDTALRLRQAGLVDPFPILKDQLAIFNEEELRRLRSPDGRLAGLPVLVQTQLSCFNRQRLSEPPATLQELLNASANGHPMGLSLDLYYLFWIVGSTGALPAIDRAVLGQPLNPAERQALTGWLAWLQNASNQQRVTFFPDQPTAEAEFKAGRLDWIPCRSTVLPQLRLVMGSALGVAPLPDGEGHRASPLNRLRVLALGRSSSAAGRRRALAFSAYYLYAFAVVRGAAATSQAVGAWALAVLLHLACLRPLATAALLAVQMHPLAAAPILRPSICGANKACRFQPIACPFRVEENAPVEFPIANRERKRFFCQTSEPVDGPMPLRHVGAVRG